MNHFIALLVLSIVVATVFTLINFSEKKQRISYFGRLMLYMVLGSVLFAWVMYAIPW